MKDQELVNPSRGKFVAIALAIGITMSVAIMGGAVFVWPGVYRYDHMTLLRGDVYPVRIHRFSGKTEILYTSGWTLLNNRGVGSSKVEDRTVPPEELAKLSATASINPNGYLYVNLYNPSTWRIKTVVVSVDRILSHGKDIDDLQTKLTMVANQVVLPRVYRLEHSGYINPLTSENMQTLAGFSGARKYYLSSHIVSATGIPQ